MNHQGGISAVDHYSGALISYPAQSARLRYDFHFRKSADDLWRYMNSFDKKSSVLADQIAVVERHGGRWRIVEAATGAVESSNQ